MNKYFIIYITLIVMIFSSCRENIFLQDDLDKNNPSIESRINYFNVSINAINLSKALEFRLNFNSNRNRIFIRIDDKKNGNFFVRILGPNENTLYFSFFDINELNIIQPIVNEIPDKVIINFNDFTGKLNLNLNRY